MRKGIHPKVNETQVFLYLGHSNWTICSLISWFCSKYFPPSWYLYWGVQFLITPERGWKWEKIINSKVNEAQGYLYLAHSNWSLCSLISWFFSLIFLFSSSLYWGVQFLITPEKGAENEKRYSPKSEWGNGVSVLGSFKLDHLQPYKLILFLNFSVFLIFILGSPIPYYPRERGWKWEKVFTQKWKGFLYLGHSNWTNCSLLSWFCFIIFPPSWSLYWGVQFLITPERGAGNEKRDSFKREWDKLDLCRLLNRQFHRVMSWY